MLFAFVGLRTDWLPPGVPFSCGAETDWLPPTYRLLSFRRKVSGEWTLGWGDASVINQLFTDYQEAGVPSPRNLTESGWSDLPDRSHSASLSVVPTGFEPVLQP